MILYRVFDWDEKSLGAEFGGPLFVPRKIQGTGRFDIPELDGVLYASLSDLGAVAETLQGFRTRFISNRHFERPDGRRKALVVFDASAQANLIDLDDPKMLVLRQIQPSQVMTHHREVTRPISQRLYHEGVDGFLWPSSIEGSWKNASLFERRIRRHLSVRSEIQPLTLQLPIVQKAAEWLHLPIAKRAKIRRK